MDDFEKLSFGIEEDEFLDEHVEEFLSYEGRVRPGELDELLDDVYLGSIVDAPVEDAEDEEDDI